MFVALAACGGTPRESAKTVDKPLKSDPVESKGKLAELESKPPAKLLTIDWANVKLTSEADALALWKQIAPTGIDWEPKLDEIPEDGPIASQLGLALLHGGNFTCVQPQPKRDCPMRVAPDIEPPPDGATFDNPCLRRMLALWAIEALDDADLPAAKDAIKAIAALPPPESQLVASALDAFPATDQDLRLELRGIAFAAGQRELVNTKLADLDDAHMLDAALKLHIDGAYDLLTAQTHRAAFLSAITDDKLHPSARVTAMIELVTLDDGPMPRDVKAAVIKATKADDCTVAAAASRVLVQRGDKKYAPGKPRAKTAPPMMRALCVLASFESLLRADEPSYLLGYVPAKGIDLVKVVYDPYSDTDADGDGDPHTERTLTAVPRDEVVLPEVESMISAFHSCTGSVCKSDDYEFRFGFKPGPGGDLLLQRLEVIERPPCPGPK